MYFVTTKLDGYILFAMTPSERAAIGLTEKQDVHILARPSDDASWQVIARWSAADFSHTDFMSAWHNRSEPSEAAGLLVVLPPALRQRVAS
ncbi:MAG: hypothetical protein HY270_22920 [Deltaproteobacteria bacterium]|nr:hypothetical protein [Deltaproteobacteria bacterium]